ncbi:hypothetical protein scyTo_0014130 [Scyliorhinus torazame]|uniref:Uncharacterized protein n=1 Tax=Scyliorhinus torazame TaxID=75743 RepID=A0A401NH73_SCYTO|nr:hypothetical protein [Scyliorhinus torazame]
MVITIPNKCELVVLKQGNGCPASLLPHSTGGLKEFAKVQSKGQGAEEEGLMEQSERQRLEWEGLIEQSEGQRSEEEGLMKETQ